MIERAKKKLREARYFLIKLESESRVVMRNEPEAADFLASAFLSAARALVYALEKEGKGVFKAWHKKYIAALAAEDRQLLEDMTDFRNQEHHEGGADRRTESESVPVSSLSSHELGGEVHWGGPPGAPEPRVGRTVRYFQCDQRGIEVVSGSKKLFAILATLLERYVEHHQTKSGAAPFALNA
ncbi:MAG: hypothetical protein HY287_05415 [Planctomycetes bacterium]|nr:hypothetical protein [Planctomycetota bacterium]MBI3833749.1 hypothetical protein [Planctomycetota bacterium]